MAEGKRKPAGEGGVVRRKDRGLAGYITVILPTGEKTKKWVYGKTEAEVEEKLNALRVKLAHSSAALEGYKTFEEYAAGWLSFQRPNITPRTYTVYESEIRNNVLPHLGHRKLKDITAPHVKNMQKAVLERAGPSAASHARKYVQAILGEAYRDGILERNVGEMVRAIKTQPKDIDVWGEVELTSFLSAATGHPLHPMYYLALMTGLRPGEYLALRWGDILIDELFVQRTITRPKGGDTLKAPKSKAGLRKVPLPDDARALLLNEAQALAEARYGRELGADDYVFPTTQGTIYTAKNVQGRVWEPLLVKAKLEHVRPYVTRHTYASMQVAAGVDVVTLARWMGHEDASFTMRCYAHFFERRNRPKAKTLSELLSG